MFKYFKFRFINPAFHCIFLLPIILFQGRQNGISNGADEFSPQNSRCFMAETFWPFQGMLPQKIFKIESLRLAKTHFQHEKYEHRYSVIRYWTCVKYIKKDFECSTHFLSYIYFQNNHRSSFYHQSCFLIFLLFWAVNTTENVCVGNKDHLPCF